MAVGEVGGAIERVDDPQVLAFAVLTRFLGEDGVVRVCLLEGIDNDRLGLSVDLSYKVVALLLFNRETFGPPAPPATSSWGAWLLTDAAGRGRNDTRYQRHPGSCQPELDNRPDTDRMVSLQCLHQGLHDI